MRECFGTHELNPRQRICERCPDLKKCKESRIGKLSYDKLVGVRS